MALERKWNFLNEKRSDDEIAKRIARSKFYLVAFTIYLDISYSLLLDLKV